VRDITTGGLRDVPQVSPAGRRGSVHDDASHLTLEDAGYAAQPPATTYEVVIDQTLTSVGGLA
jgi:hypothetical protein